MVDDGFTRGADSDGLSLIMQISTFESMKRQTERAMLFLLEACASALRELAQPCEGLSNDE